MKQENCTTFQFYLVMVLKRLTLTLHLKLIKSLGQKQRQIEAENNFIKATGKAILKIMSKMGISTLKSYCGAQIFDAVGINQNLINKYFCGTSSLIGGIGLKQLQEETLNRFEKVKTIISETKLDDGGEYAFRINGEKHAWSPSTISNLQQAVRVNSKESLKNFLTKLMIIVNQCLQSEVS